MSQDIIILSERIKELTHSTGTGNLNLDGAVAGFSAFGDYYSYNDAIYYAVTDGTDYEVGSGQYILDGSDNALKRFPLQSTNSDGLVNFSAGVKEVYVTYPGKFSVYSASGLSGFDQPQASGLAFWGSTNIVDYDSDLVWDKDNSRLGVSQDSPQYAIHIGGSETYSQINASGFIVGDSGIMFSGVDLSYSNGRQLEPFLRNELDSTTGTDAVFALSGLVDHIILFEKQMAGTVLAGPPSGCTPSSTCPENYPVFRALVAEDIPDLSAYYLIQKDDAYYAGMSSGIAFFHESGVIDTDSELVWDKSNDRLGVNKTNPTVTLDVDGDAKISGQLLVGGDVTVTGNLDVQGDVTYIDSSTVTIWDKNLELASLSGSAQGGDSTIDDAGLIIKSTDTDKKWTWRDSTDAWTTDQKIDVSGVIFNDGSTISGAYQAGSGLSLHNGLEFNVGNVFVASSNNATTYDIHQGDQVSISGIEGVNVSISHVGSLKTFSINPSELSGILQGGIDGSGNALVDKIDASGAALVDKIDASGNALVDKIDASGNALSVRIDANSSSGVAISGWASHTIDASGAALQTSINSVSGYSEAYTDAAVINSNAYTHWTIHDGVGNNENITSTVDVYVSGISGIDTYYNSSSNVLEINANAISGWADSTITAGDNAVSGWADTTMDNKDSSISGWADSTIDASGAALSADIDATGSASVAYTNVQIGLVEDKVDAVSGIAVYASGQVDSFLGTSYTSWTVSDGTGGSEAIVNGATVNISGVSGIDTQYDATNNILKVGGAAISGWIDASGAALEGKVDASGSALVNKIDASGAALQTNINSVSGWADSSFLTNSSSEFTHISGVSYYASGQVDSISAPTTGSGLVKVNNVLHTAGTGNFDAVQVGIGNNDLVKVGFGNVDEAHSERSVLIGQRAGSGMLRMQNSVLVGYHAGALSSGDIATHSGNNIFIGTNAGYASSGSEYSNFIGRDAGQNTDGNTYSNALGRDCLKNSTTSTYNNAIGYAAGKDATFSDYNEFIGYRAGESSAVVSHSVAIGYNAGYDLSNANTGVYLGHQAGYNGEGNNNISIGQQAGRDSTGSSNIYFGYRAGKGSTGNRNIEIVTDGSSTTDLGASSSRKINVEGVIVGDTDNKKISIGGGSVSTRVDPDATLEVNVNSASDVGVIVQGAAAQSADLQQWQDSSEVVKAKIDVDGKLETSGNILTSGALVARSNLYVGTDTAPSGTPTASVSGQFMRWSREGGTSGGTVQYMSGIRFMTVHSTETAMAGMITFRVDDDNVNISQSNTSPVYTYAKGFNFSLNSAKSAMAISSMADSLGKSNTVPQVTFNGGDSTIVASGHGGVNIKSIHTNAPNLVIYAKGDATTTYQNLTEWRGGYNDSPESIHSFVDASGHFDVRGMTSKNYKLHGDGYITDTTTSRTLSDSDNGQVLMFNNSSAITVTVPAGLTLGFACTILQLGTGQITFSASSTTINNRSSHTKTAGQHAKVELRHYDSNIYNLSGDTGT